MAAPGAEIDQAPMSDGGPGFVDALLVAGGGARMETSVHDPLMRPVKAVWAVLADGTAIIEMAAASGLLLLTQAERNPLVATTYGTGQLIRAALDHGCAQIIIGIGGSATVDAGAGAMQALGARLLDGAAADLPPGGLPLARLDRIDLSRIDRRLASTRIRIAADVTNTLCGPQGASIVFGPQKGASPGDVEVLDAALRRFADVVRAQRGIDLLTLPGGGAAGGIGAGLSVIADAAIEPGFALVAEATGLDGRVAQADIVITGEGRLDDQTAFGKTAAGVAHLAKKHHKPAGVVAGSVRGDLDAARSPFDAVEAAAPRGMSVEEAMRRAPELVRDAAGRICRALGGC